MIRQLFVFVFIVLIYPLSLSAQFDLKENYNWAFGRGAGLDFNTGTPVPRSNNQNGGASGAGIPSVEASASVSDAAGNLLFYTNGTVIWDRANNVMPGSANGLHGLGLTQSQWTRSTTQGALIVPMPESKGKYYLFSLTDIADNPVELYPCRLFYSIIDMQLNNGMGDVVPGQKWILLDSMLSEKMIGVRGECNNVWMLVHARDTNTFKAYEISYKGLNPVPVRSFTGSMGQSLQGVNGRMLNVYHSVGEMKVSPDRKKLVACWGLGGNFAALYDFDPSSGIVSNALQLHAGQSFYGAAFSPGSSKVYVANAQTIWQYDLTAANIVSTRTVVGTITGGANTGLKLAPDRKIYFRPVASQNTLGAIEAPEQPGTLCQVNASALNVPGVGSGVLGMPNEVAVPDFGINQFTTSVHFDTLSCQTNEVRVVATGGYSSYQWTDGVSGNRRTITLPGTYIVQARFQCDLHVDTFHISEDTKGLNTVVSTSGLSLSCREDGLMLHGAPAFTSYLWDDGSDSSSRYIRQPGTYWVTSRHLCDVRIDSFIVADTADLPVSLGADTALCEGASFRLYPAAVPDGAAYLWQDGYTGSFYEVSASGTYWLTVTDGRCTASDTILVRMADLRQDLGADSLLCREDPFRITLRAQLTPSAQVLWSTGSNDPGITISDTGTFWVSVTDGACAGSDTVHFASELCDCFLSVPDAFTPNGDGRNDRYRPFIQAGCPVSEYMMRIYDRWGRLVYSDSRPAQGWDGSLNGRPADVGVYMYDISFKGGTRNRTQYKKGDLTLIR